MSVSSNSLGSLFSVSQSPITSSSTSTPTSEVRDRSKLFTKPKTAARSLSAPFTMPRATSVTLYKVESSKVVFRSRSAELLNEVPIRTPSTKSVRKHPSQLTVNDPVNMAEMSPPPVFSTPKWIDSLAEASKPKWIDSLAEASKPKWIERAGASSKTPRVKSVPLYSTFDCDLVREIKRAESSFLETSRTFSRPLLRGTKDTALTAHQDMEGEERLTESPKSKVPSVSGNSQEGFRTPDRESPLPNDYVFKSLDSTPNVRAERLVMPTKKRVKSGEEGSQGQFSWPKALAGVDKTSYKTPSIQSEASHRSESNTSSPFSRAQSTEVIVSPSLFYLDFEFDETRDGQLVHSHETSPWLPDSSEDSDDNRDIKVMPKPKRSKVRSFFSSASAVIPTELAPNITLIDENATAPARIIAKGKDFWPKSLLRSMVRPDAQVLPIPTSETKAGSDVCSLGDVSVDYDDVYSDEGSFYDAPNVSGFQVTSEEFHLGGRLQDSPSLEGQQSVGSDSDASKVTLNPLRERNRLRAWLINNAGFTRDDFSSSETASSLSSDHESV